MIVKVFSVYPSDGSGTKRTAFAVDLAADLWDDYRHYLALAKKEEASGTPSPAMNRAVRGATWSLCSHLEGVVSGLHRWLRANDSGFSARGRGDGRDGSLCDQVLDLRRDAERRQRVRLCYLDLRLKLFRDILAHPGITREERLRSPVQVLTFPGGQPDLRLSETRTLSEVELYQLQPADIEADGQKIDLWLERLCEVYKYPRFPDTKQALEEALRPYGGDSGATHRI